ncbi:hypothetical protein NQ176_g450 [Zarea fungicola]|uniref:Uncharacterized protein n=1 Tax=Zarea fungicola TaxID=93591 RepID=A0ACC1NZ45_9HYPO|nr:hypothetical protein NQ176_g450 [Lecanicillium fungicola]
MDGSQEQPGDIPAGGLKPSDKGKGKGKEASFSDRLQASGRMALNSVVEPQPSLSRPGSTKAGAASTSRDQSSLSEHPRAEAPRSRDGQVLGDSLRSHETVSQQASDQYDHFLNAPPQMQNPRQPDHLTRPQVQSQSFLEQTAADGGAVIHLLSIPDEEPNYLEFDEALSDYEIARLRDAFFSNGSSQPTWDRLLNFSPDFVVESGSSDRAVTHMGTRDILAAHTAWLQQWHDVLSSYTDEVWGDLGSLAKDARQEIEEIEARISYTETDMETDTRTPESKALERLRQILSHVRRQN